MYLDCETNVISKMTVNIEHESKMYAKIHYVMNVNMKMKVNQFKKIYLTK